MTQCPHSEVWEEPSTNLRTLWSPLAGDVAAGRDGGGEASWAQVLPLQASAFSLSRG